MNNTMIAVVAAPQNVHDSTGRDSGCRRGYIEGDSSHLLGLLGRMLEDGWNILVITAEKAAARRWLSDGYAGEVTLARAVEENPNGGGK